MIHLVGADGQVIHANKMAIQTLGYCREEVLARKIFDLVPPESREEIILFIHSILRGQCHKASPSVQRTEGGSMWT